MAGLNERLVDQAGAAALPALLGRRAVAASRFLAGEISIDALFQAECELGPLIAAAQDLRRERVLASPPRYPSVVVALNRSHHAARLRFDVQKALCSVGLWREAEQFRRETRSCSHDLPRLLVVTQGWVVIEPPSVVVDAREAAGRWTPPATRAAAAQERSLRRPARRVSALAVAGVLLAVMSVGGGWRMLTRGDQGGDDRPAVVEPGAGCRSSADYQVDEVWRGRCP